MVKHLVFFKLTDKAKSLSREANTLKIKPS